MSIKISIEEAIKRYADIVWRIAVLYMGQTADTHDAFQETFIRYYHREEPFNDEEHIKSWLVVVCSNICKDMLRKSHRRDVPLDDYIKCESALSENSSDITHTEIFDALSKLPEQQRLALYLNAVEGFNGAEIAQMMDSCENTVYSWISRGRKTLRELLK